MKNTLNKLASVTLALAMVMAAAPSVFAANVSVASDNMTRQKISETSDHVITFTPLTSGAGPTTVTFPAGFDLTGATGGTVAGQVVTVAGALTAATPVSFTIGNVVNPGTVANYAITLDTGVDTGEITVPIITDDQIQITAKVDQTLYFDVRDGITGAATDNTVQFGTLTAGAARYATDAGTGTTTPGAASELEAGTNAAGGYIIDVTGETLTSMDVSANTIDGLFTPAASAAGTEQFGINVAQTQASTGATTGAVSADYATNYHLPDTATTETLVTNTGPSSNEIYDVTYLANISSLTPAGNYTTTLTYTMTANF